MGLVFGEQAQSAQTAPSIGANSHFGLLCYDFFTRSGWRLKKEKQRLEILAFSKAHLLYLPTALIHLSYLASLLCLFQFRQAEIEKQILFSWAKQSFAQEKVWRETTWMC